MINDIKFAIKIISNPEKVFSDIHKKTFDDALYYYFKMLIFSALAAGIWNFIFSLGRAIYDDVFLDATVQYLRKANYAIGSSVSIAFLFVNFLYQGT